MGTSAIVPPQFDLPLDLLIQLVVGGLNRLFLWSPGTPNDYTLEQTADMLTIMIRKQSPAAPNLPVSVGSFDSSGFSGSSGSSEPFTTNNPPF